MSIANVFTGIMMGGQLFSGFAANEAARSEARALEKEAALARKEGLEEADRLDKEHKRFLAYQSLMYMKGGVTLKGSPLFVLKETREEAKKQVNAQRNRANALYGLGRDRASRVRNEGRAALIGGMFNAAGTGSMFFS